MSTLTAAALLVASAANLQFNAVGAKGISVEELAAIALAAVAIVVANLANKEREIPELGQHRGRSDVEDFEQTFTRTSNSAGTGSVNPTTASIISGILGQTDTMENRTVESAISTLSTGEFAANVEAVLQAPAAANRDLLPLNSDDPPKVNLNDANKREARPTDETTGETLQRVLVKPVPLPGREDQPTVDPATIPGLEPNRVFVREGAHSVPLPGATVGGEGENTEPSQPASPEPEDAAPEGAVSTGLPELPDLSALLETNTGPDASGPAASLDTGEEGKALATPQLPDLGDLFDSPAPTMETVISTPALPDLDELF
jgi:hypothetical protein